MLKIKTQDKKKRESFNYKACKPDIKNYTKKIVGDVESVSYKDLYNASSRYDKNRIMRMIEKQDVDGLVKLSRYFYYKSGIYKNIVDTLASIYLMYYKVIPRNKDKLQDGNFAKNHKFVFDFLDFLDVERSFTDISKNVVRDGAFYGYLRENYGKYSIQELPREYCRSVAKYSSGNNVLEFNLTFFSKFKLNEDGVVDFLNLYPDELVNAFILYSEGEIKEKWYQVKESNGMCFRYDDLGMPMLTGIFTDLIELDNYKKIESAKNVMDLFKLVVQKVPISKETGEPLLDFDEVSALHQNLLNALSGSDNVDGLTTPLDVEALKVQDSTSTERNNLQKAERSLFNEAGLSANLYNAEGNIALNKSIQNDESKLWSLIMQYQRWINTNINQFRVVSSYYNFDFEILPLTIYNQHDWQEKFYQGATVGFTKIEYAISLGVKQKNLIDKLAYENEFMDLDNFLNPILTSHTISNNEGGRPSSSEDKLDSSGIVAKETNITKNSKNNF